MGMCSLFPRPKPAKNSWAEEDPTLLWHDWAPIQPDGGFRFASIPRGGFVQLLAVCDGWVAETNFDEANDHFVMGQKFDVQQQDAVDAVVQMEPTGILDITVVDPQGQPLGEGSVACSPNQAVWMGGSTLLGQRLRTLDFVERQLRSEETEREPRPEADQKFPFMAKLDSQGKVRLTGIPLNRDYSLNLFHDALVLDVEDVRFRLDSPEPQAVKVKAVPGASR